MATEFEQRVRAVGERITNIREQRARAEAKLEELGKRRGELLGLAERLGVEGLDKGDPVATIRASAAALETQANEELTALEEELGL